MSKKSKTKNQKTPKRRELKTGGRAQVPSRMNRRQSYDYYEALDLYENGDFTSAEEILLELDRKGTYLSVIELLSVVYFEEKQYNKAATYAKRLMLLAPEDVEARLKYANAAMYEGYATVAMNQFLEIERRSPNHESLRETKDLVIILKEESAKRIAAAGFPTGSVGLQLQGLHEESLFAMANSQFETAIANCEQILATSPEFWSARNNLAMANFHAGNMTRAIEVAETTTQMQPRNRFAAALLAKMRFLTGNLERPERLLDDFIQNPPDNQDAAIQAAEWMAMAGYDEELVRYLQVLPPSVLIDPMQQGMALHLEAYGRSRLGQIQEARKLWKKSIQILPQGTTAQENLNELNKPVENATWAYEMAHWIPQSLLQKFLKTAKSKSSDTHPIPAYLKNLIPAFLDRGDPALRQLAVALCMIDGSIESIEMIRQFAISSRGADACRYEVLVSLLNKGLIDRGPHCFYSQGKRIETELRSVEIHEEAKQGPLSPVLQKKMQKAQEATTEGDFDLAESIYTEILKQAPESNSVEFNRASLWMQRDGKNGERRAEAVFKAIHQRDPDYMFAGLALAQLHAVRGELKEANEMVGRYCRRERMHVSEAKALYTAQAKILTVEGKEDAARQVLKILEGLCGDQDRSVIALREAIDGQTMVSRVRGFFKRKLN